LLLFLYLSSLLSIFLHPFHPKNPSPSIPTQNRPIDP
jgi:hypothetical protein